MFDAGVNSGNLIFLIFVGVLLYLSILKSKYARYPNAARGCGFLILGWLIVYIGMQINLKWFSYLLEIAGGITVMVGIVLMIYGAFKDEAQ
jgi:hypothetical protein